MDHALAGHLVDQRDGAAERVFHLRGIPAIDCGADRPERAPEAAAELAVRLAADDVLTVSLECRSVTGHRETAKSSGLNGTAFTNSRFYHSGGQPRPLRRRRVRRSRRSGAPA